MEIGDMGIWGYGDVGPADGREAVERSRGSGLLVKKPPSGFASPHHLAPHYARFTEPCITVRSSP
ncbi:hypothetical protein D3A96_01650 [Robertkochia marina]|nr:hypothetical protein D3A96_01650 [Robertkochia marina]